MGSARTSLETWTQARARALTDIEAVTSELQGKGDPGGEGLRRLSGQLRQVSESLLQWAAMPPAHRAGMGDVGYTPSDPVATGDGVSVDDTPA